MVAAVVHDTGYKGTVVIFLIKANFPTIQNIFSGGAVRTTIGLNYLAQVTEKQSRLSNSYYILMRLTLRNAYGYIVDSIISINCFRRSFGRRSFDRIRKPSVAQNNGSSRGRNSF